MPQLGLFEIGYAELGSPSPTTGTAYTQSLTGSMNTFVVDLTVPTDVISRQTDKTVIGSTAAPAASLVKRTARSLVAATQTVAASVSKQTRKALAAATSTWDAVESNTSLFARSLTASVTAMSAALAKSSAKALVASAATYSASQVKNIGKSISAGAEQYSAALTKSIAHLLAQSLTLAATVSKTIGKDIVAAASTLSGAFVAVGRRFLEVILSASFAPMSGAVSRMTLRDLAAETQQLSASITRSTAHALLGATASMVGVCSKAVQTTLQASLSVMTAVFEYVLPGLTPAVRTIFVQYEARLLGIVAQAREWLQNVAEARLSTVTQEDRAMTVSATDNETSPTAEERVLVVERQTRTITEDGSE